LDQGKVNGNKSLTWDNKKKNNSDMIIWLVKKIARFGDIQHDENQAEYQWSYVDMGSDNRVGVHTSQYQSTSQQVN